MTHNTFKSQILPIHKAARKKQLQQFQNNMPTKPYSTTQQAKRAHSIIKEAISTYIARAKTLTPIYENANRALGSSMLSSSELSKLSKSSMEPFLYKKSRDTKFAILLSPVKQRFLYRKKNKSYTKSYRRLISNSTFRCLMYISWQRSFVRILFH